MRQQRFYPKGYEDIVIQRTVDIYCAGKINRSYYHAEKDNVA
jgi:hypothetical protein